MYMYMYIYIYIYTYKHPGVAYRDRRLRALRHAAQGARPRHRKASPLRFIKLIYTCMYIYIYIYLYLYL